MSSDSATAAPRKVFLFSGHMIDAPGRKEPRFPADREGVAAAAIGRRLDDLGACADDLAICGGACGGDLLFAEAALARGVRLELYLPLDEASFLAASVDFADADWHDRYLAAKAKAAAAGFYLPPADEAAGANAGAGPGTGTDPGTNSNAESNANANANAIASAHSGAGGTTDPYEANNLRMLEAACRYGSGKVDFIALWNGRAGDGPGGTKHLMDEVTQRSGRAHWLDTRKLWG